MNGQDLIEQQVQDMDRPGIGPQQRQRMLETIVWTAKDNAERAVTVDRLRAGEWIRAFVRRPKGFGGWLVRLMCGPAMARIAVAIERGEHR